MAQYELNLRDYLRIFRKRKWIILPTFITVSVLSFIVLSKNVETYRASATIKIEERKTIAGLLTEWIVYNPGDIMESEARFITSFPVMANVAYTLEELKPEWFFSAETILKRGYVEPESVKPEFIEDVNQVVANLRGKVEAERVASTNMIRIIAATHTAKEAAELANTVAEVYVQANLREKNRQATHGRQFIEEQLNALENKLRAAEEEKLRSFGEGSEAVKLAEPIEQKLVELQFKLAELMQKYTERHPEVIRLREQIRSMEQQIHGVSGQQLEYSRLLREIEVSKKLYAMLKEKLEEARITEAQKVSDVSIVDRAVIPGGPVSGDNTLKMIMGMLLGGVLGVALAFVLETLDTSIGTIDDVENVIKLTVLGVVPPIEPEYKSYKNLISRFKEQFNPVDKSDSEERFVHLFSHFKPQAPITEAFRNIHTNLKLSPEKKTILITSSGPREGKSCVVCNLGIVMAQIGLKTLLVSTDLRRPILAKMFGVRKQPGISELVRGTATLDGALNNITDILLGDLGLEDVRKTPGIENIWILPSGEIPANPVEILESKALAEVIEKLKELFDVIIFDSPPVLPVTDASLLASKLDTAVVVYEIGRTSREGLMRAKVQLEAVGAKISGVILNHTQPQTEVISPYPYYRKYKYYGKKEEKKGHAHKKTGQDQLKS